MTTNTNANANASKLNFSHANCTHEKTKNARAKCRREMRALFDYDAMRNDVTRVDRIDANDMKLRARANVDESQLTIDDAITNAS